MSTLTARCGIDGGIRQCRLVQLHATAGLSIDGAAAGTVALLILGLHLMERMLLQGFIENTLFLDTPMEAFVDSEAAFVLIDSGLKGSKPLDMCDTSLLSNLTEQLR